MITLYDYFRSSACYRVRIALNLKKLPYKKIPVHLVDNGGEHHHANYKQVNPQELVPSLDMDGHIIHQSLAIIEYLEEVSSEIPLLPPEPLAKAQVRSVALMVACDIHPLNNLRILNALKQQFHADEAQIREWYHQWLKTGFNALETVLSTMKRSKPYCFGSTPTIADVCLIPQVYNAHRFEFSMENYPIINDIYDYCQHLPAFREASPE